MLVTLKFITEGAKPAPVRRALDHVSAKLLGVLLLVGCAGDWLKNDSAFEAAQTKKLLGIEVQDFTPPQGPTGFDDLPGDAREFVFAVTERRLSGAKPKLSYEPRRSVLARASDGSIYEAYCGYDDPKKIVPGHRFVSTLANRRQRYGGTDYHPQDVYIGKQDTGRVKPTLFFRDVGSHTTSPHHLAIDSHGRCHLIVADVNIYQNNRLHLFWVIGDPLSGEWTAAWLIDRRGFTSECVPWSASFRDKVHLVWNWCDASRTPAPGSGLYHLEWSSHGFGRKVRVASGDISEWDAAVDPKSGRLLVVFSKGDGVYVISRVDGNKWTRAARLHPELTRSKDVSVEASENGTFVIRTGVANTREWLLRPR
jgi:hypothetical protein